ncbi:hypothetical protein ACQ4PT_066883 [Festuca glaucescens]
MKETTITSCTIIMKIGRIDDDISAKHRREVINTPDIAPTSKRKQSKKDKGAASSMKMPGPVDDTRIELMFDQMMIKLTKHIDNTISKQMEKGADVSAQKFLKMLNAKGVVYRAGKDDMSDNEEEEVDKKEGVASTPSHGLQPKDFMDCDIIKSDDIDSWLNYGPTALFNYEDATDGSNPLTPEIIDAAMQYVRKTCKARRKDKKGTTVYQNADGAGATAEFVQVILDRGWLCGAAYFAVNIADCHWCTVVMHGDKKQFQVLNSLWSLKRSKAFVQKLRAEIVKDVEFANNEITEKKYPDVSNWEIKSYDIPQQKDG